MAHPSRIQDRVAEYLESRPEVARQVTSFEVPGEFARKELEDRLRISEDRYRLLFEHALDAILILEHGQIAQVNQRATEMLGRARSQLHGRSCAQLAPPVQPTGQDSECYFDAHLERALDGSVEVFDLQCTGAGGQLIDTVVSLHRVEGIPGSVLALLRDVTEERRARAERERLEDEVRQLQKMEALGTLAGGVAHDFNNILTGILGAVEVLRGELAEDSPCHAVAADARAAIGRASGLVRQLLTFASSRQHLTQTVDLGSLVEEGVRLLRETMDPRIDLRTQVTGKTGLVDGDPNQLTQVLVNLALNSRDAILQSGAGGGESRVGSDPWIQILVRPAGTMHPSGNSGAPAREYVLLQVVDSGAGMPGHVRDRACEPFFTTKPVGQGTGLGLTMVYGIVQRHGGWLEIDSEPGRGATVSIYLPVVTTAPPRPHPSRVTPTVADRTGTILFVDDEVLLRELAHRHLEPIGHRVISAGSGNEALEILQREEADDLVVVLDLLMPGLSGLETLRRMLKLRPRLRVLVASGFSTEAGAPELLAEGAASFLPKPYSFSELADQVQVLLCGIRE
jgi:two-component system cell cycle sensor histidine kinase/response regulator CckA